MKTLVKITLLFFAAISLMAQNDNAPYVPGQLLIQFEEGASKSPVLGTLRATQQRTIRASNGKSGDLVLVTLPKGLSVAGALEQTRFSSSIKFAEPNWIYTHSATSNDPAFTNGSLWGMYGDASSPSNQYGSQAAEAWAAGNTGDSAVYIGVIDEGFMTTHEDLAANTWVNPFDPVDGIDNDGNGYVDDVHGWDFDKNDNSVFDGTIDDHGTHVAGTIGGVGGNGVGVAGVAWNVTMISGKFLGRRGGTTANAILAVDYFTDLKNLHGLNIVATNNSWGGGGFSQGLADAISRAEAADILFIAAAGNISNNNDASAYYPATYNNDNIIAVASITSSGNLSSFSSYGATTVDIGAPGSSVYSTLPARSKGNVVSAYGSYSGTSMATPHVCGAAAIYAAANPGATAAQIKAAILNSAEPTPSLSGITVTGGRLNVETF